MGNDGIDVVIATPPCQGISVINHKKNDREINRNSLVVESVEIINRIKPRFFVFENVMAFQKHCASPQMSRSCLLVSTSEVHWVPNISFPEEFLTL
ncbi:MAG: DNA cytosine methyltransferase [[Ruminococcus] torques]